MEEVNFVPFLCPCIWGQQVTFMQVSSASGAAVCYSDRRALPHPHPVVGAARPRMDVGVQTRREDRSTSWSSPSFQEHLTECRKMRCDSKDLESETYGIGSPRLLGVLPIHDLARPGAGSADSCPRSSGSHPGLLYKYRK